jgi:hypothetical protein
MNREVLQILHLCDTFVMLPIHDSMPSCSAVLQLHATPKVAGNSVDGRLALPVCMLVGHYQLLLLLDMKQGGPLIHVLLE